jgi:hypothetical protein
MKSKILILIITYGIQSGLLGQNLEIEPYEFITKAKDTINAELVTFNVREDRINGGIDSIQLSFIRFKSTNPNP